MASLKKNILLNYVNTITGIIFPIITFPYASRILHPEGIGVVNFHNSIISYIILFTSLGIPLYAVKEVAKYRDDIYMRNKVSVEITLLSLLLSALGYVAVFLIAQFSPQINENITLFYVLSLSILFNALGVNWFYQAVEEFQFITIRALIIRILAALSLFIFVKKEGDIIAYALISIGSTVGNNLINFYHLRKFIQLHSLCGKRLDLRRHLKPTLRIFVLNIITSLYIQLNTVMLGYLDGDYAVGIYSAGNKLSHIILSVVSSMSAVMLPRCSNLVSNGKTEEFANVIKKSLNLILMLSLPFTFALMLLSEPLVFIFCGSSFSASIPVVYWTAPIIIFIALTNIIGIQVLYPLGKEKLVIFSTLVGALLNLALNFVLIPLYSAIGTAVSTLMAELAVFIVQIWIGRKYFPVRFMDKEKMHYLIGSMIMVLVIVPVVMFTDGYWLQLIVSAIVGVLAYGLYLLAIKDVMFLNIVNQFIKYRK